MSASRPSKPSPLVPSLSARSAGAEETGSAAPSGALWTSAPLPLPLAAPEAPAAAGRTVDLGLVRHPPAAPWKHEAEARAIAAYVDGLKRARALRAYLRALTLPEAPR
jgi:hypothetical protein